MDQDSRMIIRNPPDDLLMLARYRTLKDRELRAEGNRFIAEGKKLVERLIASPYPCESVLCSERIADEMTAIVPPHVPLIIASDRQIDAVIGFRFHNGCLAVGIAPPLASSQTLIDAAPESLLVIEKLNNTENLGAILRIAAGFGVDGVILDDKCADPFYRQSIRVSMGTVFSVTLAQSVNLVADLQSLAAKGYDVIATVTHADAEPIQSATSRKNRAIVLGSEAHGLSDEAIAACTRRVTIPMHLGTDSLNISIAGAIFMYHFSLKSSLPAK